LAAYYIILFIDFLAFLARVEEGVAREQMKRVDEWIQEKNLM
jgi:hypothetical protein